MACRTRMETLSKKARPLVPETPELLICACTHTYTQTHTPLYVYLHIHILTCLIDLYMCTCTHQYHICVLTSKYMPCHTQFSPETQLDFTNTIYLYNVAKWSLINSKVTFLCSNPISAIHRHAGQNTYIFHMCSTLFVQFPLYSFKCRWLTDFRNKLQFLTFSHNLALVTKKRCLCCAAL